MKSVDPKDPRRRLHQFLVYRDIHNKIQSIATCHISADTIHISYMMTNPDNIKCTGSKADDTMRGAGSAIVAYVAKMTLSSNKSMKLTSLPSADYFWKHKMHFKQNPLDRLQYILKPLQVQLLIATKTKPYDQIKFRFHD